MLKTTKPLSDQVRRRLILQNLESGYRILSEDDRKFLIKLLKTALPDEEE